MMTSLPLQANDFQGKVDNRKVSSPPPPLTVIDKSWATMTSTAEATFFLAITAAVATFRVTAYKTLQQRADTSGGQKGMKTVKFWENSILGDKQW